jgi:PKD repeat protein
VDYGYLKNRLGSSWDFVLWQGYRVRLVKDSWYSLRVVNDFTNNISYLYLNGESVDLYNDQGEYVVRQTLGNEIYLGTFNFRNTNVEAVVFRTGADKSSVSYSVDDVCIYQLAPMITVTQKEATIDDFKGSATYTLAYSSKEAVTITCDKTEGFAINDNQVTFTAVGTYTFTLSATNQYGVTTKTITVVVQEKEEEKEPIEPQRTTLSSVDFTNTESRPSAPTGKDSGTAEYTSDGLKIATGSTNGTVYYDTTFDTALSGVVTVEITFSLNEGDNGFINLLFFNNSSGTPACCYAIGASGQLQHSPSAGKWISQTYNGKTIYFQKSTSSKQYWYTIKLVADFDNKSSVITIYGDAIKLDSDEYTIGEDGMELASNTFRGASVSATMLRCGVDSKQYANFTIKKIDIYTNEQSVD